jgi:hypothetical protein
MIEFIAGIIVGLIISIIILEMVIWWNNRDLFIKEKVYMGKNMTILTMLEHLVDEWQSPKGYRGAFTVTQEYAGGLG